MPAPIIHVWSWGDDGAPVASTATSDDVLSISLRIGLGILIVVIIVSFGVWA